MKRVAFVCVGITLSLAVGCSSQKKEKKTYSSVAAATSGTSGTTSGTGGVTSGTAGTSSSSTPGATPSPSPSPSPVGGTGVFNDGSARLPSNGGDDWTVAAGDVDGDTDIDLVFGTNAGGIRLVRNNGTTFADVPTAFPALTMNTTDVHLVDMDKDNDLDLVVSANYEPVRVFLNDGTGTFTAGAAAPTSNPCLTYKIAVGDLNGDTYPDVYMANAGQATATRGADVVLLNDQAGGLVVSPNALPGLLDDTLGVAFADVDKDNDLDVLAVNFASAHALLINDGAGNFTHATANLPTLATAGATATAAADLNGDGFVDFYIVNEGLSVGGALPAGAADVYLLNDGTGRFNDASILLPTHTDVGFNVRLVDINGDNAPDAIVANLRGVQRLYLNQGGAFTDATSNYPAINAAVSNSMGVAVADLNGDRALDIVYAQRGASPWLLTGIPR